MIISEAVDVECFVNLFSVTFVDMKDYFQKFADCIDDEKGKPIPLTEKLSVAEIEKRLEIYLNTHIFPQLEKIDVSEFNNLEQSMKVIIISSIQEVLKEMMKENLLMLCPEDFALVEQIINSEEKEINKPTQQNNENKDDKPKNENENKDDNSSGFKNIINKIFG